ncbi:hypothetical protein LCGC14_2217460 [marine sediment metagenome]|uniref:Uncharacterized protein n=1 Tax=marine sediment metagenome TaxID=412755 RepID=A0A0F9DBX3_9ZZZZ
MTEATWCEACDHHIPAKHPARDMCGLHPRHDGFGFVRKGEWDDFPPFLFCKDVNNGGCPLFEPKRAGEANAQTE